MTNQHPITPPEDMCSYLLGSGKTFYEMLTEAARWGADQELEACCEWLLEMALAANGDIEILRHHRRPKPKSLVEEALDAIDEERAEVAISSYEVIRRALKRLHELEGQGDG